MIDPPFPPQEQVSNVLPKELPASLRSIREESDQESPSEHNLHGPTSE